MTRMKYVSIGIVILFISVMVVSWLRKTPEAPSVPESTVTAPVAGTEESQKEPQPIQANKKRVVQGMTIETIKEGSGEAIVNGKTAVVHYTGKLENGTVFDSSKTRGTPFEFPLGAGMVIKGWELGVLGMKVGETRILTIPAELGYGATGTPGGPIPPNATLIFEVELLGIK